MKKPKQPRHVKIEDRRKPKQPLYNAIRAPLQQLIVAGKEDTTDPPSKGPISRKTPGSGENDLGPNLEDQRKAPSRKKKISREYQAWWETPAAKASNRNATRKKG